MIRLTSCRAAWSGVSMLALIACGPTYAQTTQSQRPRSMPPVVPPAPSPADANQTTAPGDIIVTAQKRSENINSVPLAITAATGDQLTRLGVSNPGDLMKIVPGFQFTKSFVATPVYTLRGIGFYDTSVSATSTVAIYVDEVPLPFVITTTAASLDVERVEVIKGPQGTLFGQNATGGAIDYIAAKPTDTFKAGIDASYGRFNDVEASGFVSGPITDNLKVRFAGRAIEDGKWQYSITRPGDKLGAKNEVDGRMLLDWKPTSTLSFLLNLNGWRDDSDLQSPQEIVLTPNIPSEVPPSLVASPIAPNNARATDWTPGYAPHRDATFKQAALRTVADLTSQLKLTSLTSIQRYSESRVQDFDGSAVDNVHYDLYGNIHDFSQELRLNGDMGPLTWIVGGNYDNSRIIENTLAAYTVSSVNNTFVGLGIAQPFLGASYDVTQYYKTKSGFGNVDYKLTDKLSLSGGVRYTRLDGHADACVFDGGNGAIAQGLSIIFSALRSTIGLPPVTIGNNECFSVGSTFTPQAAMPQLHEHNVAWRGAVDYKIRPGALVYASISRGYKGGSFPTLGATTIAQFDPAVQERLQAYEVGAKVSAFDRRVQINGSGFYYDYANKQFRGHLDDPIFGPSETELNIPKSRVYGAELQANGRASQHLDLNLGVTYLNTLVLKSNGQNFVTYDNYGSLGSLTGQQFPYTPRWELAGGLDYHTPVGNGLQGFFGANARYQTHTTTAFSNTASTPAYLPLLAIKSYGVLDLRIGIEKPDAGWRLSLFGNNVTNTYYWTNSGKALDTTIRYAALPATYGIAFSYRM